MKHIIVYIEPKDASSLKRTSYEALTAARSIAGDAQITAFAVQGNEQALSTAGQYGVHSVVLAKHELLSGYSSTATAEAIAQYAQSVSADTIILSGNASGKEIAPRLSVKLKAGLLPDCIALSHDGGLKATRPVYAGKAHITVEAISARAIIALRPNVFTAKQEGSVSATISSFAPTLEAKHAGVKVTSIVKNEGRLDVAEADIIVSGGRGMKGPEHFPIIEQLASTLNAAVGASRAVVDAGWRPHGEQVGQTGKTVSPSLYVACGISGAVQHLAGMSSSKFILAINKDKDAPIFKVADYGIVGDVFEVLPVLDAKLKAMLHS
ncbi:MAG: electron transfer flavoprotein subunit alpha/FixB family protein [Ignavibacteria bacterium]